MVLGLPCSSPENLEVGRRGGQALPYLIGNKGANWGFSVLQDLCLPAATAGLPQAIPNSPFDGPFVLSSILPWSLLVISAPAASQQGPTPT